MMVLKSLTLDNFGPYKGKQEILLPKHGVTIVYGDNMRGKTTLLNAFRYALFGRVVARHSREIGTHLIGNWEAQEAGEYGFRVTLTFAHEGDNYILVRECKPRPGVSKPTEADFVEEPYLQKGSTVLGPGESKHVLAKLMPEEVSRFFLFDGELLQEYEDLLDSESEMGAKLTTAIENILGVPILTNARSHLREIYQKAQKQESSAAQKNRKTEELGNALAELTEIRTFHQKEFDRLQRGLLELKEERVSLEGDLKRTERVAAMMNEREKASREISDLDARQEQKQQRIREYSAQAWKAVVAATASGLLKENEKRMGELQTALLKSTVLLARKQAIVEGTCPVCGGEVKAVPGNFETAADTAGLQKEMQDIAAAGSILRRFIVQSPGPVIAELLSQVNEAIVNKAALKDRIQEISEQLRGIEDAEVRRPRARYDQVTKEIALAEHALNEQKTTLAQTEEKILKVEKQLDKQGGGDIARERRRRELAGQLGELFNEAVARYRDDLRVRVEKDASELFLKLTTEPEYTRLSINQNYGLTIMHRDGSSIPVRSSGAEHVVALALLGALHKNAPLRGPVILDSPFGRLDEKHTSQIIRALPSMADQVVLLVYESELPRDLARKELKGQIRSEFSLGRVSARHTVIEPAKEATQ